MPKRGHGEFFGRPIFAALAKTRRTSSLAVLSEKYGYVFIQAPRTACTTVSLELMNHFSGEWLPPQNVVSPDGTVIVERKHATLNDLVQGGVLTPDQRAGLFVFTTVRNPFDSLVSLWHKQANAYQPLLDDPDSWVHRQPKTKAGILFARDHSFPEWLQDQFGPLLGGPSRHLYAEFIRGVDRVMRYENLQEEFDNVLYHLGASDTGHEIPLFNVTEGREKNYRTYYDESARDLVASVFGADLERFGYVF